MRSLLSLVLSYPISLGLLIHHEVLQVRVLKFSYV
jgi:hypothetical protein